MKYFPIEYFVAAWKLTCQVMLSIVLLLHNTTNYSILLFPILKYNDIDSYSSPVELNNGISAPNNGTVAKKGVPL